MQENQQFFYVEMLNAQHIQQQQQFDSTAAKTHECSIQKKQAAAANS